MMPVGEISLTSEIRGFFCIQLLYLGASESSFPQLGSAIWKEFLVKARRENG